MNAAKKRQIFKKNDLIEIEKILQDISVAEISRDFSFNELQKFVKGFENRESGKFDRIILRLKDSQIMKLEQEIIDLKQALEKSTDALTVKGKELEAANRIISNQLKEIELLRNQTGKTANMVIQESHSRENEKLQETPTMKVSHSNPLHKKLFPQTKKDGTPFYEDGDIVRYKRIVTEENLEKVLNKAFPNGVIPAWGRRKDKNQTMSDFVQENFGHIEGLNNAMLEKIPGNSSLTTMGTKIFDNLAKNNSNFIKKDDLAIAEAQNWVILHEYETDEKRMPYIIYEKLRKRGDFK